MEVGEIEYLLRQRQHAISKRGKSGGTTRERLGRMGLHMRVKINPEHPYLLTDSEAAKELGLAKLDKY
jgi:hypothetical protein